MHLKVSVRAPPIHGGCDIAPSQVLNRSIAPAPAAADRGALVVAGDGNLLSGFSVVIAAGERVRLVLPVIPCPSCGSC